MTTGQFQKIIFGLKVRQLRQEKGWNFEELGKATGISISYLNEIEKGKKFPQPENQEKLARALEVSVAFLNSPEMVRQYAPLGDLLKSNFLSELPLDFFGIELQQIVEIVARAPERVNAFISALLEIARNYSLREENFFFAALRAYQELRNNYFEEIEEEVDRFVKKHLLPENGGVPSELLKTILEKEYHLRVETTDWTDYPELAQVRSLYIPGQKRILLHAGLNETRRAFYLGKELGYQVLKLEQRPHSSLLLKVGSFEEVLNNYRAAYFAVGILINRKAFASDIRRFFDHLRWEPSYLEKLMDKYQASPDVLFQRFNILTRDFNLDKVFFLRFIHHTGNDRFEIDKELHLNRRHQPHATGLREHYCRRWLSVQLLRQLKKKQEETGDFKTGLTGVQRVTFINSGEQYLCIALAKPGFPTAERNVSVTLGVLLDEHSKKTIKFWNDEAIPEMQVNVTCERCPLTDCRERASEPSVLKRREEMRRMQFIIEQLTQIHDHRTG